MSKKIKVINPIFLAVLMALVSGCGYKKEPMSIVEPIDRNKSEDGDKNYNVDELPVEDIASDVDTSKWQTYRNEEYGFDIMYPSDWMLQDERQIYLGIEQGIIIVHNKKDKDEEAVIYISGNNEKVEMPGDIIRDSSSFEPLSPIIIDGHKTYLSYKRKNLEKWVYRYFFEIQSSFIQIYYRSNTDKDKDVIYGIMNSIKFFNKNK